MRVVLIAAQGPHTEAIVEWLEKRTSQLEQIVFVTERLDMGDMHAFWDKYANKSAGESDEDELSSTDKPATGVLVTAHITGVDFDSFLPAISCDRQVIIDVEDDPIAQLEKALAA